MLGRKFGDPEGLTPASLERVTREGQALLVAARMDVEGVFQASAAHQVRRHSCGFRPVYMSLSTVPATAGAVLKYN